MLGTALLVYLAAMVIGFSALLKRSAQARGVEAQQFKWFMVGMVIAFAVVTAGGALYLAHSDLAKFVISNGVAAIPISIGVAVLRHRLYDIDLLIKRTVVYGATSAAIAAMFFLGIVALQGALSPLTSGSELAVASSTLAAFALFRPIRHRIQDAVNRRFDRSRYDAARTLDAFSDELRDEVDLERVAADLLEAVSTPMAPQHVSLWLRRGKDAVTISGRPVVRKELA